MYFEGGISSVYLWDLEDGESASGKEVMFAGVVLLKKSKQNSPPGSRAPLIPSSVERRPGVALWLVGFAPCLRMPRKRPVSKVQIDEYGHACFAHGDRGKGGGEGY
jgi:hypothetical protein